MTFIQFNLTKNNTISNYDSAMFKASFVNKKNKIIIAFNNNVQFAIINAKAKFSVKFDDKQYR